MTAPYHPPVKRSITIAGHQTSISLEPVFWTALEEAAVAHALPLSALVAEIDALRIVVSNLFLQLVAEGRLTPTPAISAAVEEHAAILDRANTTLLVIATPASACAR